MNIRRAICLCWSLFLPILGKALPPSTPVWLIDRLAIFDLQVHDFATTGRGLQTTRDRPAGDVLVRVPEAEALTVASMLQRYPILEQAAEKSIAEHEIKLTDEQVLAAGLLLLREDKDRYVLSLPLQQSVLQMPEQFLAFLPLAYQKLIRAYKKHCTDFRESMIQVLPGDVKDTMSEERFLWAFATVRSRCVGMDGADDDRVRTGGVNEIRVMLPGFDLLNHKFGAQTRPGFSDEDHAYIIKSNDAYANEDQVFISYSDERDNLRLLMTYGFCIPGNPQQVVAFDAQELLEACAAARPQYFSNAILGQLWSLMEKLGKHRDMYAWDGSTQEPQESLHTGINMMIELEKQFLVESDDSFADDILAALLLARRLELAKCRTLISDDPGAESLEKMWIPIVSSIKLLLEEEESYLGGGGCAADEASTSSS